MTVLATVIEIGRDLPVSVIGHCHCPHIVEQGG